MDRMLSVKRNLDPTSTPECIQSYTSLLGYEMENLFIIYIA